MVVIVGEQRPIKMVFIKKTTDELEDLVKSLREDNVDTIIFPVPIYTDTIEVAE